MLVYEHDIEYREPELFEVKLRELSPFGRKSGWIAFMDYVTKNIPYLLKPGAPSKIDVQNSLVGKCGYSSWADLLKDKLDVSNDTWVELRKAYVVVKKFPYLRNVDASRSAINTARKQLKERFPDSPEAWREYQKSRTQKSSNEWGDAANDACIPQLAENSDVMTKEQSGMNVRSRNHFKESVSECEYQDRQKSHELEIIKASLAIEKKKNLSLTQSLSDAQNEISEIRSRKYESVWTRETLPQSSKQSLRDHEKTLVAIIVLAFLALAIYLDEPSLVDIEKLLNKNTTNSMTEIEGWDTSNEFPCIFCD